MMIYPKNSFAPIICASAFLFAVNCFAETSTKDPAEFSLYNPDGKKYEFVKAYVMALEYLYQNENKKKEAPVIDAENITNTKILTSEEARLKNANLKLRIAKNLLNRYEDTSNGLINKVFIIFDEYANKQVELNNAERVLISTVIEKVVTETFNESTQKWYAENIKDISFRRKESSMQLFESSLMVGKVLVSHEFDREGQLYKLGITKEQRRSLIRRLRAFDDKNYQGEPRGGQTFLEASVSALREMLEDTSWPASDHIFS